MNVSNTRTTASAPNLQYRRSIPSTLLWRGGADARSNTIVLALDGDKWKPRPVYRTRQGGNGFGINSGGASYTLNTVDRHIVAILGEEK